MSAINSLGSSAEVSMAATCFSPQSLIVLRISSASRRWVGAREMFTMKGFPPVSSFISSRASANSSMVGQQVTFIVPMPPALQTADASWGTASHCIPLCTMGYSMPNISVSFVFILFSSVMQLSF